MATVIDAATATRRQREDDRKRNVLEGATAMDGVVEEKHTFLSSGLLSFVHALVAYASREMCGKHHLSGVVLDRCSHHC
jgi:hypothetical protein